ncbi:MAG: hypothetical protein ABI477_13150 [Chryseolinea sp.]
MEIHRREISQAIGELAYVVATADKGQSAKERAAFYQIAKHKLDHESWAARSSFEFLDGVVKPSIEEAYNGAIHKLRKYKDHFTAYLKEKAYWSCRRSWQISTMVLLRMRRSS